MAYFNWVGQENTLSAVALTIRAQTISPNDQRRLLWDIFFPRRNVDSVKLRTITMTDFRPVADRREWNTRGRLIPMKSPKIDELEMVPIESYFRLAEREIQDLEERTQGNQTIFRQLIGADLPTRTDTLAESNFRRIEVDSFRAWANGTIVARNAQTNTTSTFSFGFDSARYQTAGTAWNTVANAYDEFIAWVEAGIDAVGSASGAYMRLATYKEILKDAPTAWAGGSKLTRRQLQERVEDELGRPFQFYLDDRTFSPFTDAGIAFNAAEKYWPVGKVALVPAGERVGTTAFAPVARAFEIQRGTPGAGIDVRGQTVYPEVGNGGRELTIECQVNAMPLPEERLLWVIDAGV